MSDSDTTTSTTTATSITPSAEPPNPRITPDPTSCTQAIASFKSLIKDRESLIFELQDAATWETIRSQQAQGLLDDKKERRWRREVIRASVRLAAVLAEIKGVGERTIEGDVAGVRRDLLEERMGYSCEVLRYNGR